MRRLVAWLRGLLRSASAPADSTEAQMDELRRAMRRQLAADERRGSGGRGDG